MNRHTQGIALIFTLGMLVVIAVLVFGAMYLSSLGQIATRNDVSVTQAEYAAKAGLQKYKTAAFEEFRYYVENADIYAKDSSRYSKCGNLLGIGLDLNRDGIVGDGDLLDSNKSGGAAMKEWVDPTNEALGRYEVRMYVNGATVMFESTGYARGATATMSTILQAQNAGAFSNAITAGTGQSGKHINGGTTVYGSVYVEGSDPNTTVIGANGNFEMRNHYSSASLAKETGMTETELSFLRLETQNQPDLCANLRVAKGKVKFSGSAAVGEPEPADGTYTGAVANVAVGKGLSDIMIGNKTATQPSDLDGYVYSDRVGAFDLNPAPTMPRLDATGICKTDPTATWRQCMQRTSSLTFTKDGAFLRDATGTLTKVTMPASCALPTTVGGTVSFGTVSMNCTYTDAEGKVRGFKYDYDKTTLTGQLVVDGTLDFQGFDLAFAQNVVVRYTDKATLLVEARSGLGGNITIDGNILAERSFPDLDVLGMVAENTLSVTGKNQNKINTTLGTTGKQVIAGMFYAGNTAAVSKDSAVFGNVTANMIDASTGANGGGKPTFVQVPGLEFNPPPGFDLLLGTSNPTFKVLAYERR